MVPSAHVAGLSGSPECMVRLGLVKDRDRSDKALDSKITICPSPTLPYSNSHTYMPYAQNAGMDLFASI